MMFLPIRSRPLKNCPWPYTAPVNCKKAAFLFLCSVCGPMSIHTVFLLLFVCNMSQQHWSGIAPSLPVAVCESLLHMAPLGLRASSLQLLPHGQMLCCSGERKKRPQTPCTILQIHTCLVLKGPQLRDAKSCMFVDKISNTN